MKKLPLLTILFMFCIISFLSCKKEVKENCQTCTQYHSGGFVPGTFETDKKIVCDTEEQDELENSSKAPIEWICE